MASERKDEDLHADEEVFSSKAQGGKLGWR